MGQAKLALPTIKSKPMSQSKAWGGATAASFGANNARGMAGVGDALMKVSSGAMSMERDRIAEEERLQRKQEREAESAANKAESEAKKASARADKEQYLQYRVDHASGELPGDLESLFGMTPQGTDDSGTPQDLTQSMRTPEDDNSLVRFDGLAKNYVMMGVDRELGLSLSGGGSTADTGYELSINEAINYERPDIKETYDEAIEKIKEQYAPRIEEIKKLPHEYMLKEMATVKGEILSRLAHIEKNYDDTQTVRRNSRLEAATKRNGSLFVSSIMNNDQLETLKHNGIEYKESIENYVDNKFKLQDLDDLSRETKIQEFAYNDAKTKVKVLLDAGKISEAKQLVEVGKINLDLFTDDMELDLNNQISKGEANFKKAAITERANNLGQEAFSRLRKDPDADLIDLREKATTSEEVKAIDEQVKYYKSHEKEIQAEERLKADRALAAQAEEMKYLEYGQTAPDPVTGEEMNLTNKQILAHNENVKNLRNNIQTPEGRELEEELSKLYGEKLRSIELTDHELKILSPDFIRSFNTKRKAEETKYQSMLSWYEKEEDKGGPPESIKDKISDLPEDIQSEAINKAFSMSNQDGHVTHEEIIQNINKLTISTAIRRKANYSGVLSEIRASYIELNRGTSVNGLPTYKIPVSEEIYNYTKNANPEIFKMIERSDNPTHDEWENNTDEVSKVESNIMIDEGKARRDIVELTDKDKATINNTKNVPSSDKFKYDRNSGLRVAEMGDKLAIYDGKGVRIVNKKRK